MSETRISPPQLILNIVLSVLGFICVPMSAMNLMNISRLQNFDPPDLKTVATVAFWSFTLFPVVAFFALVTSHVARKLGLTWLAIGLAATPILNILLTLGGILYFAIR